MKKVMITGADGMLGTDVVAQLSQRSVHRVIPLTIQDMDITDDEQVQRVITTHRPDVIIHCAAYTAVDAAEENSTLAFDINAEATLRIAEACLRIDAELIFISTDYVFNGNTTKPYVETDKPEPLNIYGASKLKGEEYVQTILNRYKIVRTSWLSGIHCPYGLNFVEKILEAARTTGRLFAIDNQWACPTFTFDLSRELELLLGMPDSGIFHITNQGICSCYEFACSIIREFKIPDVTIMPVDRAHFPTGAKRPQYSALENKRLKELGLPLLSSWQEALAAYHRLRLNSAST